ncbi:hypothetical protein [Streptomyces sp. NPDC048282]|uniref:hypothetical protein n=1 Tax=Streptomyces sp. NPDC048282 TaxID=3365528 RepID=UPI003723882B
MPGQGQDGGTHDRTAFAGGADFYGCGIFDLDGVGICDLDRAGIFDLDGAGIFDLDGAGIFDGFVQVVVASLR